MPFWGKGSDNASKTVNSAGKQTVSFETIQCSFLQVSLWTGIWLHSEQLELETVGLKTWQKSKFL